MFPVFVISLGAIVSAFVFPSSDADIFYVQ